MAVDEAQRRADTGISESEKRGGHSENHSEDPLHAYRMAFSDKSANCLKGTNLPNVSIDSLPDPTARPRTHDPEMAKWMAAHQPGSAQPYDPIKAKLAAENQPGSAQPYDPIKAKLAAENQPGSAQPYDPIKAKLAAEHQPGSAQPYDPIKAKLAAEDQPEPLCHMIL